MIASPIFRSDRARLQLDRVPNEGTRLGDGSREGRYGTTSFFDCRMDDRSGGARDLLRPRFEVARAWECLGLLLRRPAWAAKERFAANLTDFYPQLKEPAEMDLSRLGRLDQKLLHKCAFNDNDIVLDDVKLVLRLP